ncbi:MAG: Gfo/Idh/MocA family oxidoreductase [Candidatus Latescibacteria bacterium]|nr:Gfo/Idh/MocA family oxidoreductase [Candidatus Latescibacterota bacterium]
MDLYTVGLIGCGRIASLLEQETRRENPNTHAGCYDYCDRTRIVAAADRSDERRQAFGVRWDVSGSGLYANWQEMLDAKDLDIVSVCTYPIPHRDMVVAAAQSGVKAIFCEKSMAVTLREADEMIDVCQKNNVKLSINHGRRWDWQYRKIKELIDQQVIGSLQAMALQYRAGLANNGTHYFDMLRFFAGDVAWAMGRLANPDALDSQGSGYFQFQSGVECIVNGSSGANGQHLFELIGSKGRITVGNIRPPEFRIFVDGKEEAFPEVPEDQKVNTFGAGRCVIPLSVIEIVESLDQDQDTVSTGHDGRAALEMVLSFHESERLGNARVDFPMQNLDISVLVREDEFISSAVPQ